MIIDLEVVTKEFLSPADLSEAQTLCLHKPMEVVVVNKYKYLILRAFQVVLPSLKNLNNGLKLTIVNFISGLSWNYLSWEEGYRIPLAQIIRSQLTENSTNNIAWYICLNPDMTFWVKVIEDWRFDKRLSIFGKGHSSSKCEKTRFCFFRLRQIFGLR